MVQAQAPWWASLEKKVVIPMVSNAQGGNVWENAYRASENDPLAQFDAGTSDLLPPSMQTTS